MVDPEPYLKASPNIDRIIKAKCVKVPVGNELLEIGRIYTIAVTKGSIFVQGECWRVLDLDTAPEYLEKGKLGHVPYYDSARGYFEEVSNSIDFILS